MENINEINNYNTEFKKSSKICQIIKMVLCVIGIIIGALLLLNTLLGDDFFFGISIFGYSISLNDCVFGADFYTEIYTATSRINDSIGILSETVESVGKTISIMLGFVFILGFGIKLLNIIDEYTKSYSKTYNYNLTLTPKLTSDEQETIIEEGGWKCPNCDTTNPNYITTCKCGTSKNSF